MIEGIDTKALFSGGNFSTETETDSSMKIQNLEIEKIDELLEADHPFHKTLENEAGIEELARSVKENGIIEPIIVLAEEDRYIIHAGHRRFRAAKMNGFKYIPAIVKNNITKPERVDIIIDTNMIRAEYYPSEIANAIKMKMEYFRSGEKIDISETAIMDKTRDVVANDFKMSGRNAQNYYALTRLIDGLLQCVDDKKITVKAGAILSTLAESMQTLVYELVEVNGKKIDEKLAREIKAIPPDTWGEFAEGKEIMDYLLRPKEIEDFTVRTAIAPIANRYKKISISGNQQKELCAKIEEAIQEYLETIGINYE